MKKKVTIWIFSLAQHSSSTTAIRFTSPYSFFPDEFEFTFVPSLKALFTIASVPDVVLFHRILYPFGEVYKVIDFCRAHNIPTGMEVDDLIIDVPPQHSSYPWHIVIRDQIRKLMSDVDFLTVTTERLKNFLLPYNKNIYCLPNLIDLRIWDFKRKDKKPSGKLVIGYGGTMPHSYDFASVVPAIKHIAEKYGSTVSFEFIGCLPEALRGFPGVAHTDTIDSYPQYARFLKNRNFDIVIAPLDDNPFSQSKSNCKFLEYSVCGYPGIYSRVGPYIDSVVDNETGILVGNDTKEWIAALQRLIGDEALRKSIAANAFNRITTGYLLQRRFSEWVDTYRAFIAAAGKTKRSSFSCVPLVSYGPYMVYAQFREVYYALRRSFQRISRMLRR